MKSIDPETFGAFICRLRREKGMTQKQLAEALKLSPQAVSKWERARSLPDIALWPLLAETLGVTLAELAGCRRLAPGAGLSVAEASGAVEGTLDASNTQLDRQKRRQRRAVGLMAALLTLVVAAGVWFQIACIAPVPSCPRWFAAAEAVQETGTEQWQGLFPPHSAYRLGLNAGGKPVFLDPAAALRQARTDCSDAVRRLRQERKLPPLFHFTVQAYGNLGWQLTDGTDYLCTQGRLLSAFADIYENSFA